MIPLILVGVIGALIVVSKWDEITDWIREVLHKGCRILAKAINKVGKIFIRFLAKSENQTIQTREIPEDEVPDYILNKVKNNQETSEDELLNYILNTIKNDQEAVDITDELENELY